ncbi:Steroid receptor RNA activator 1 [Habropoda laboriosa]|uniref:Steroid receptor RNA activator 1 n=2 Tax=Habropoda laboriosa TaxID=597456 RepID=A0A0L7QQA3_9HYME|nr:Steroid receptor RNA activator 1 [Habropoda laboriosa]
MQKVLSSDHEPGWNDPPKWAYCATQSSAAPIKRVLNKRVAFPLASSQAVNKESFPNTLTNMPPPLQSAINLTTASHPPLLHPLNKNVEERMNEMEIDKEQTLNDVFTNFEAVISEHVLEKSKAEEVKKRLDVLKTAWLEDKLNNVIYKNILDLSTALREGNVEKADQIHVALMMQHASLCSAWIPGIRHIILGLKTKMQSLSVIQCNQSSESHLLPAEENK